MVKTRWDDGEHASNERIERIETERIVNRDKLFIKLRYNKVLLNNLFSS
jgi:hypothetical protein